MTMAKVTEQVSFAVPGLHVLQEARPAMLKPSTEQQT